MPEPAPAPASPLGRLRHWIGAWQPLTGPGLAAFASATVVRVVSFQVIVAAAAGTVFALALRLAWFPVIDKAVTRLPESARLVGGKLGWPDPDPIRLADNPWLDLVVHPAAQRSDDDLGQTSDLQLDLRPVSFRIAGALGHLERTYPALWDVDLGRLPALAKWHAWRLPLSVILGAGFAAFLLVSWWTLATAYAPFAWIFARMGGRQPTLGGSWKLAAASLWVGAIVGTAGIAAYATGMIRLPGLIVTQVIHVPVPWIWLAWGVLSLPTGAAARARTRPRSGDNPFAS